MDDRYILLIVISVFWLLFYFLVSYSLNEKEYTFHKYAFFTIINSMFIFMCFVLLSMVIKLEKQEKILKYKIERYDPQH